MAKRYTCINCGSKVNELYKVYSSNVLKLTTCTNCLGIADKYIEYDIVLVIINLILLQKEGYRHIICNTEFKGYWKLAFLILTIEAYADWKIMTPSSEILQSIDEFYIGNFEFYRVLAKAFLRFLIFTSSVLILTYLHKVKYKKESVSVLVIIKTLILSSFGLFLLLPSLIWDNEVQDFHLIFVLFYTTLSQLFAYEAICGCSKLLSVIIIGISYCCKLNTFYDTLEKSLFNTFL